MGHAESKRDMSRSISAALAGKGQRCCGEDSALTTFKGVDVSCMNESWEVIELLGRSSNVMGINGKVTLSSIAYY
jgi:hypothetical protein